MLFVSISFIIFILIVFSVNFILPYRFRWIFLLISSYFFYSFNNPTFLIFLLISTISTFLAALVIGKLNEKNLYVSKNTFETDTYKQIKRINRQKNFCLIFVIIINIGIIFYFKQKNFIFNTFNLSMSNIMNFILPLGISYYTLQALGYTIDVYRNIVSPEKNIAKYALFISFFPQFVMGPISRFSELSYQFFEKHPFNKEQFMYGIQRIVWGFFKKLVIADRIGIFVDFVYNNYYEHSGIVLVLTILLYSFQIYADFSGYMDIAVGVSNCLGIRIKESFNSPYFSKSVQEFWGRWNITLYSWFRDYVFYSILRSKYMIKLSRYLKDKKSSLSAFPMMFSILFVWFLVGLWHDFKWNYIVASLYQGVLIILYMVISRYNFMKNLKTFFKIFITFSFISFGHFLCRIPSLSEAKNIIYRIFQYPIPDHFIFEINTDVFSAYQWCITIIGIFVLLVVDFIRLKNKYVVKNFTLNLFIIYLLLLCTIIFGKFGATTFIYLQF